MRLSLFPSTPNTRRVRELKDFYWDVGVTGRTLAFGYHDVPPFAEVRLERPLDAPAWQGDVLVLSDAGEFVIAVNRGLVVSVSAEALVLPDRKLDREERALRVRTGDGHFLVYFEWGDALKFADRDDGRVEITSPGADWPLMLFVAHGPSPALADTEMDRMKSVNMGEIVALTQSFGKAQPRLEASKPLVDLWEHVHHLHRVNTFEPEPPFIYEWECATRTDRYAARVVGHWDTLHTVWDWLLIDATRARQEFENYLKGYDPKTAQMALDVAPIGEDVWPREHRQENDGRCMVSSHPPVWPELAWQLYLVTNDRSWLDVTYEVAKLNIGWWERERDRDRDGLFEYADTRYPQPWESGCDGSPRFDELSADGFACVDLNCQLVMFYRNLVRFAMELGERKEAAEFSKRQDRLVHLVRERLWDASSGWFFDRREDEFVRVRTTAGMWAIPAGVTTPEQLDAMLEHIDNPDAFATWFPLPSVSADERTFAPTGWRGPARASQVFWIVMGLRHAGRVDAAGRIVRRALDAMSEVLAVDGTVRECYNPLGPKQDDVTLFDWTAPGEPVRRYYLGHAPVRAMVLMGLLGVEPTRDGLLIAPAGKSLDDAMQVEFILGKNGYVLETRRETEGVRLTLRRGRKQIAEAWGNTLVPRVDVL